MRPAWYKKTEPKTEEVERLPEGGVLYRYTEINPMTGRKTVKYAVDSWWRFAPDKNTLWFPTAAAAKLAWAMRPEEAISPLSYTHDDQMDAYAYLLQKYYASGTGITKIMIGPP